MEMMVGMDRRTGSISCVFMVLVYIYCQVLSIDTGPPGAG